MFGMIFFTVYFPINILCFLQLAHIFCIQENVIYYRFYHRTQFILVPPPSITFSGTVCCGIVCWGLRDPGRNHFNTVDWIKKAFITKQAPRFSNHRMKDKSWRAQNSWSTTYLQLSNHANHVFSCVFGSIFKSPFFTAWKGRTLLHRVNKSIKFFI